MPGWLPELFLFSAICFGPLAFGAVEFWAQIILEVLIFCAFILCAIQGLRSPSSPARRFVLPAVGLIVLVGLMQWLAPHPVAAPSSLGPFTVDSGATGKALLLWCAYAAALACLPQILARPGAIKRFSWLIFAMGVVVSVIGISQLGQGNTAYYGLRPVGINWPFGPYTNRNHAASMMGMALCVGLGIFVEGFARWRSHREAGKTSEKTAFQVLVLFLIVIIGWGIIKTTCRGAVNALFIAGIVMAVALNEFSDRRRAGLRWSLRCLLC
ncbi:MAG: hypothetical protein WC881_04760, partial [Elusimicrobiota bacterium]